MAGIREKSQAMSQYEEIPKYEEMERAYARRIYPTMMTNVSTIRGDHSLLAWLSTLYIQSYSISKFQRPILHLS